MSHHVEVVVHRGLNRRAPENTFAAAQRCVDLSLDYVEVDVRTSRDGVFHILHDTTVDRTTDGHGALAGLTAAEIARLDAGSWFAPEFAGERIPRLDELLRWAKGRIKVYLDVKQAHPAHLLDLIYATGMEHDCFLYCEQVDTAETLRALDGEITLMAHAYALDELVEAQDRVRAQIVEIGDSVLTPELMAACRAAGRRVMVFAQSDDPVALGRILALEPDLINTDHAEAWLRVVSEHGAG